MRWPPTGIIEAPPAGAAPPEDTLPDSPGRFALERDGIITDGLTGLQWLIGPESPLTWEEAVAWVRSLRDGWRMPTRAELRTLYVADSRRLGEAVGDPPESFALRLPRAFAAPAAYWVWAEARDEETAWGLSFITGIPGYGRRFVAFWLYRAFAVRSPL